MRNGAGYVLGIRLSVTEGPPGKAARDRFALAAAP